MAPVVQIFIFQKIVPDGVPTARPDHPDLAPLFGRHQVPADASHRISAAPEFVQRAVIFVTIRRILGGRKARLIALQFSPEVPRIRRDLHGGGRRGTVRNRNRLCGRRLPGGWRIFRPNGPRAGAEQTTQRQQRGKRPPSPTVHRRPTLPDHKMKPAPAGGAISCSAAAPAAAGAPAAAAANWSPP